MPLGKVFRNTPTFEPKDVQNCTFWVRGDRGVSVQSYATVSVPYDFSAWTQTNVSTSVNVITDPDGTTMADAVYETAVNNDHRVAKVATSVADLPLTFRVNVKNNGRDWVKLQCIAGTNAYANFNLTTGQFGLNNSILRYLASNRGNGWWQVSITGMPTAANASLFIYSLDSDTNSGFLGDITKGIYLHNAEVVQNRVLGISSMGYSSIRSMEQAIAANQPGNAGLDLSGQQTLDFQGTTSGLYTTSSLAPLVKSTAWTAFHVSTADTLSSTGLSYVEDTILEDYGGYFWLVVSSSQTAIAGNYVASVTDVKASTYNTGSIHVVETRKESGNIYVRVDNGVEVSGAVGTTSGTGALLQMGFFQSSQWFDGRISELIVYNRALSSPERARVRAYLGNRYGVTVPVT